MATIRAFMPKVAPLFSMGRGHVVWPARMADVQPVRVKVSRGAEAGSVKRAIRIRGVSKVTGA